MQSSTADWYSYPGSKHDYNKADFSAMSMYLNGIDWTLVYADCTSATELWTAFV